MRVTIAAIDQRYSLSAQSFSNSLVIELPSGAQVNASVSDDVLAHVLAEARGAPAPVTPGRVVRAGEAPMERVPTPPQHQVYQEGSDDVVIKPARTEFTGNLELNPFELEADTEPQGTSLEDHPEDQLEHHVEEGLVEWELLPDTQLPPSIKKIMRESQVSPMLTIEDLDKLKFAISQKLAQRAKPGVVDWNSGPRRAVESAPRRTVAMDEAGNPVPPGGIIELREEKDLGERREEEEQDALQA